MRKNNSVHCPLPNRYRNSPSLSPVVDRSLARLNELEYNILRSSSRILYLREGKKQYQIIFVHRRLVGGFGNDSITFIAWEKTRRNQLGVSAFFVKAVAQWRLPVATGNRQGVITEVVAGGLVSGVANDPHNSFHKPLTKFIEYEIGSDNATHFSNSDIAFKLLRLNQRAPNFALYSFTGVKQMAIRYSLCCYCQSINWLGTKVQSYLARLIVSCCSGWKTASKQDWQQNLRRKNKVKIYSRMAKERDTKIARPFLRAQDCGE